MTEPVSGFVVLRRPEENYDEGGHLQFSSSPPRIGEVYYTGIVRMPWFDVANAAERGSLSAQAREVWQEIERLHGGDRDLIVTDDLEKAKVLVDCLGAVRHRVEVCAVDTRRLPRLDRALAMTKSVQWLGVDLFCGGYGSMLLEGVFRDPALFPRSMPKINRYGLFELNDPSIDDYIEEYVRCERERGLEEFEGVLEHVDRICLARIVD